MQLRQFIFCGAHAVTTERPTERQPTLIFDKPCYACFRQTIPDYRQISEKNKVFRVVAWTEVRRAHSTPALSRQDLRKSPPWFRKSRGGFFLASGLWPVLTSQAGGAWWFPSEARGAPLRTL